MNIVLMLRVRNASHKRAGGASSTPTIAPGGRRVSNHGQSIVLLSSNDASTQNKIQGIGGVRAALASANTSRGRTYVFASKQAETANTIQKKTVVGNVIEPMKLKIVGLNG